MIPKIIHIIWLGPKRAPLWCINSWKINFISKHPEWEFILWNEEKINNIKMINHNIYNSEPTLRGKSDIARYEILNLYGGIFLDADSYWIEKDNSDLGLLIEIVDKSCKSFFCAKEPKNTQYFANGVFGSYKNNEILKELIDYLNKNYYSDKKKNSHKYDIWQVTGPVPFTKIVNKNLNKVHIFESYLFFPEPFKKGNTNIKLDNMKTLFPNSYMYQYWLSHTKEYSE